MTPKYAKVSLFKSHEYIAGRGRRENRQVNDAFDFGTLPPPLPAPDRFLNVAWYSLGISHLWLARPRCVLKLANVLTAYFHWFL